MNRAPSMGPGQDDEEARLAAEFEQDAAHDGSWEEAPAPVQRGRASLGAQVTIRLGPATAEQLREVAGRRGVAYTSLLRGWIEERLSSETARPDRAEPQMTYAGRARGEGDAFQVSGQGQTMFRPIAF